VQNIHCVLPKRPRNSDDGTGENLKSKNCASDHSRYDHATHFSYDVHGNVNELIQDYPEFTDHSQQYKHLCYEYDLISGNVNKVMYQHDPYTGNAEGGQFYHLYYYDADPKGAANSLRL
jgi:hypothetical protein